MALAIAGIIAAAVAVATPSPTAAVVLNAAIELLREARPACERLLAPDLSAQAMPRLAPPATVAPTAVHPSALRVVSLAPRGSGSSATRAGTSPLPPYDEVRVTSPITEGAYSVSGPAVDRARVALFATSHAVDDIYQGAVPALLPFLVADRHYSYAAATV